MDFPNGGEIINNQDSINIPKGTVVILGLEYPEPIEKPDGTITFTEDGTTITPDGEIIEIPRNGVIKQNDEQNNNLCNSNNKTENFDKNNISKPAFGFVEAEISLVITLLVVLMTLVGLYILKKQMSSKQNKKDDENEV